jgi:adenylate kinase family enzyme
MQSKKPQVIFVLGGPGSGKGTHCVLLKEKYHFIHYSVGDILREYINSGTKDAQEIKKKMLAGEMVSSRPIVEALKVKIQKGGSSQIYMIDGSIQII